jgi:hypothetical protein
MKTKHAKKAAKKSASNEAIPLRCHWCADHIVGPYVILPERRICIACAKIRADQAKAWLTYFGERQT